METYGNPREGDVRAQQQPLGSIHAGRLGDETPRPDARPEERLRRAGTWVEVTFRGLDSESSIRFTGWLNLATVRSLSWDADRRMTTAEFVGQKQDEDDQRIVERPEVILGIGG